MLTVSEGRDGFVVPLPALPGTPIGVRPGASSEDRGVLTAFLALNGDLSVDEWCDPVNLELTGLSAAMRQATASQARADARLVSSYLWGAAELAARIAGGPERERRAWGARQMLTEIALVLRLPEGTLARRIARLTRLAAMPRLADANARGAVSSWHLDVVLDVMRGVEDPGVLAAADEFLASRAERMTAPELRASARGWKQRHVPRTDEQRRRNLADRRVDLTPCDEDLMWLSALIPVAQAMAIDARLDEVAARLAGVDERTRDQVRADAFVGLLLDPGSEPDDEPAGDGMPLGRHDEANGVDPANGADACAPEVPAWVRGVRPELVLTVPVLSLLGRSDEPATLEGVGPIDLDTARLLAANAPSFVRVLTHPETGAVLSVGRDRYRLPADLRRAVELRDVTCRFPGCRRPARRCDVDHVRAWAAGGSSEACNLQCLCAKHHRMKHVMGWAVTEEPDGAVRWRSPLGRSYWTQPGGVWPPRPAPPPKPPEPAKVSVTVLSGYPDEPGF